MKRFLQIVYFSERLANYANRIFAECNYRTNIKTNIILVLESSICKALTMHSAHSVHCAIQIIVERNEGGRIRIFEYFIVLLFVPRRRMDGSTAWEIRDDPSFHSQRQQDGLQRSHTAGGCREERETGEQKDQEEFSRHDRTTIQYRCRSYSLESFR